MFTSNNLRIYKGFKNGTSIMAKHLQARLMKLRRRAKYERLDEQLKLLVSSFDLISRDMYFK